MNFKDINKVILSSKDVLGSIVKDTKFYDYLLSNNVAYHYSLDLTKNKGPAEKQILVAGQTLNRKYLNTLKLIYRVCQENRIEFILFKTYKYFSEIVDGDIDLIIRKKDFYTFLEALEKEGFNCFEHEKLKAVCSKQNFCNVEPRTNSSFHGIVVLDETRIWKKVESIKIGSVTVLKPIKEIDLFHLLLNILYGPSYLKLYLLLLYKNSDLKKLFSISREISINQDLEFIITSLITTKKEANRFPLFMGNVSYIVWWLRRILPSPKLTIFMKLKIILFFFYAKYRYILFNSLVFRHTWPL